MSADNRNQVIVRIAPSPTGNLHVGTARTALFNYLFAKKHDGKFLIRIEDTDVKRSEKKYEKNILEGLEWLGITSDVPIIHQSKRTEVYKKYAEELIKKGLAYEVRSGEFQSGKSTWIGMKKAVILKNPKREIVFTDVIRGEIKFEDTPEEIVILKSDGTPTYNFAVVIDDNDMGITHVIRGEDHISNTPRQIVLLEALGFNRPVYAHIPMILAPDRSKLSKRHGAVSLLDYRDNGYLPEAMVNYLALLGWNPGTEQEIFIMQELIEQFDLGKIQKGGAIFDEKKFQWVNKEHMKRLPEAEQRKILLKSIENEPYIIGEPELEPAKIPWKKNSKERTAELLEGAEKIIEEGGDLLAYAEREGKGDVLWPVRYALTGAESSPDPLTILEFFGKEKSLSRLKKAIIMLKNEQI
ncbi:MAG: glutamate--tRNA ligase family protein [Patescibacteria group bacterium]